MNEYEIGKDVQALRDNVRSLAERLDRLEKGCKCKRIDLPLTKAVRSEEKDTPSLTFSFPTQHAGDCTMSNPVLTVFADGKVTFSATVQSSSPSLFGGDTYREWWVIMDGAEKAILNLSQINSPNMVIGDAGPKSWYENWGGVAFPELSSNFTRIEYAGGTQQC